MAKNIVIVESPAKAKTIENYLGSGYKVYSSFGHIRDLPKNNHAIDVKHGFEPTYEITKDKLDIVNRLRSLAEKANTVYLASDDDREGESIAWHLKEALELKDNKTKRIVFREITKKAIEKAIQNPRTIDLDLVNSQQARRVLDRLVGFDLSPVLWHKIRAGLSAGRVQSVAVRLIVEREREILKFKPQASFIVKALFKIDSTTNLPSDLNTKFKKEEEVQEFLEKCKSASYNIEDIETKPSKKSPSAPFTTSTLQQEASQKLGYSVSQTMTLAQRLYEAGKISYMRTDSVNLSDEAIENAKIEIENSYGNEYVHLRKYKTKSSNAQEAHEAIRPTNFSVRQASSDTGEQKLYNLIWRRAIASQMADAKLEKTNVKIGISNSKHQFVAKGEVVKFKGFLEVYDMYIKEEGDENLLPPLHVGQELKPKNITSREKFSKASPRYSEAALVKKLEEEGIGRPSTYAPIISTIQKRGYVVKESREGTERKYISFVLEKNTIKREELTEISGTEKNKLFPTDIGMIVNDFLVTNFPNITDYGFTARVEKQLDEIAHKSYPWKNMISDFYKDFTKLVHKTDSLERGDVKSSKLLGKDPQTGKPVIARVGKYGPLVQIGEASEEEKPRFAGLRHGQLIETLTLEEALELFKLPREVGEYENEKIIANIGRFGPYLKHIDKFYSLPKEEYDPYTIGNKDAIEVIEAKRKADREKIIKTFDEDPDTQILNGRWGPYLRLGKKNIKIPKDLEPKELTYKQCIEIAENTDQTKVKAKPKAKTKTKKKSK